MYPNDHKELFRRNAEYASSHVPISPFTPEQVAAPKMIVLSCIDHRVVPEHFLNLKSNEVIVIRNAGGRAQHAVHEIACLELLTTIREVLVIHHTNCGLTLVTDEKIREGFARLSGQAVSDFEHVNLGCFTEAQLEDSVKEDVAWLRSHPLMKKVDSVVGAVYDLESGKLKEIEV